MKCCCNPNITENERWANQVLIELPESPERERRISDGLSTAVSIDPCIVDDIKYLWGNGIITNGCCCGHNSDKWYPMVNVYPECADKMAELGYEKSGNPLNEFTYLLIRNN